MKKKLRILLADDDKDDRFFFEKALQNISAQTELSAVEDGEKLMSYLMKNTSNLPDILFLDINMPRKNGSECLVEIKGHDKLKNIPVIMYSTSLHDDVADLLHSYGASYYIQKTDFTFLPDLLERTIGMITADDNTPTERKHFIVKSNKYA
jgi:CheY-like chemotaxis protein